MKRCKRKNSTERKIAFTTDGTKTTEHPQRISFHLNLTPYTKIKSKQIIDINIKQKQQKSLEFRTRDRVLRLDTQKMWSIKGKIDKLDVTEITNFCSEEERLHTGRKYLQSIFNKGAISKRQ